MDTKLNKAIAPYVIILLGILFLVYNFAMLQDPKPYHEGVFFYVGGGAFIGTGILMLFSRDMGTRLFTLLTVPTILISCYTILYYGSFVLSILYLFDILYGQDRVYNLYALIGFHVGLIIYMFTTRQQLAGSSKYYSQNASILGLLLMAVSIIPYIFLVMKLLG